jgi:hypothetical protein
MIVKQAAIGSWSGKAQGLRSRLICMEMLAQTYGLRAGGTVCPHPLAGSLIYACIRA